MLCSGKDVLNYRPQIGRLVITVAMQIWKKNSSSNALKQAVACILEELDAKLDVAVLRSGGTIWKSKSCRLRTLASCNGASLPFSHLQTPPILLKVSHPPPSCP